MQLTQERTATRLCSHCEYDLAGLPCPDDATVKCPECGASTPINRPRLRKLRLAPLTLWPWPLLWTAFWVELIAGFTPETIALHLASGAILAAAISTITAAAALAVPSLRRNIPLSLFAACWLFGNFAFFSVAWVTASLFGSASV